MNSKLAEPRNDKENEYIQDRLKDRDNNEFIIGINDYDQEGKYVKSSLEYINLNLFHIFPIDGFTQVLKKNWRTQIGTVAISLNNLLVGF